MIAEKGEKEIVNLKGEEYEVGVVRVTVMCTVSERLIGQCVKCCRKFRQFGQEDNFMI